MPKHKDRKHAQWSASSTERNWLCPGNLALAEDVIKRPENRAAAWGTACHEVAEKLLNKNFTGDVWDDVTTERHVIHIDQEMMDVAWVYVDYIREQLKQGYDLYAVEKKFALDNMNLPMDIGGTADAVLYNQYTHTLEVVDLKTGKGAVVEATGNPQARFYALGVLVNIRTKNMLVRKVVTTIVQPRYPHREGIIRSEHMHVAELIDWTIDLVPRVNMAALALKTYPAAKENTVLLDKWVDDYLVPGETQCQFCDAAGGCPALRRNALDMLERPNSHISNSIEAVEADLDMLEQMESWIRERRALAHEMAVQGQKFDHWVLVERIGHRKFDGKDEADTVAKLRARIPLSNEQLYDQKLKSPAGLERAIGKKAVEEHLGDIIIRPITGTDLIRNTATGRTPAPTVTDFIVDLENENGTS